MASPASRYLHYHDLGRGSSGSAVALAARLDDLRFVALKSISLLGVSDTSRTVLLRELMALKLVAHPGVARYLDAFIDGASLHIVEQYCAGGDLLRLAERFPGKCLPSKIAQHLLGRVLATLAGLHQQGLWHHNIRVSASLLLLEVGLVEKLRFAPCRCSHQT